MGQCHQLVVGQRQGFGDEARFRLVAERVQREGHLLGRERRQRELLHAGMGGQVGGRLVKLLSPEGRHDAQMMRRQVLEKAGQRRGRLTAGLKQALEAAREDHHRLVSGPLQGDAQVLDELGQVVARLHPAGPARGQRAAEERFVDLEGQAALVGQLVQAVLNAQRLFRQAEEQPGVAGQGALEVLQRDLDRSLRDAACLGTRLYHAYLPEKTPSTCVRRVCGAA